MAAAAVVAGVMVAATAAAVVAGVMVAATVIELGHLLHHYWSRPDTAGSVFPVR